MTVGEDQKALVAKKLAKFDKFFGSDAEAYVTFAYKRKLEIIEISITYNGILFTMRTRMREPSKFAQRPSPSSPCLPRKQ